MRSYTAAFLMALALAALLTPAVRWLAMRWGVVSSPGGRNVHQRVVPRLGGIAIALSALAPLLTLFVVDSGAATWIRQDATRAWALLFGATLMCGIGAIDDARGLRASHKLVFQLLAATVAFKCGLRIDGVMLPFVGVVSMGVFAYPLTVLWIVGVTNAVNLIDGLDGLAAGVVFFAATTNLIVALLGSPEAGVVTIALLMSSLMGSLVGFLFYNFNPARIFMEDSGSYFLGFVLAASALFSPLQKTSTTVALLVPMVALGVPIFDTLLSMLRRVLERRPIFSPDRGHIHHRLLEMGITHRRAVLTLYGFCVVLAVLAIAVAFGRDWQVGAAILCASAILIGLLRFAGYFHRAHGSFRARQRLYDERVSVLRSVLPEMLERLRAARTSSQVLGQLEWFIHNEGADALQISGAYGDFTLRASNRKVGAADTLVAAAFPLGPQASAIFLSAPERPWSTQSEMMLQLLTDVIHQKLAETSPALEGNAEAPPAGLHKKVNDCQPIG